MMKHLLSLLSLDGAGLFAILAGIAIGIGVFMLLRDVMLWYWKVKDLLKHQQTQTDLLKQIAENTKKDKQ